MVACLTACATLLVSSIPGLVICIDACGHMALETTHTEHVHHERCDDSHPQHAETHEHSADHPLCDMDHGHATAPCHDITLAQDHQSPTSRAVRAPGSPGVASAILLPTRETTRNRLALLRPLRAPRPPGPDKTLDQHSTVVLRI